MDFSLLVLEFLVILTRVKNKLERMKKILNFRLISLILILFVLGSCSNEKKQQNNSQDSSDSTFVPQTESSYQKEDEQLIQAQAQRAQKEEDSLAKTEPKSADKVKKQYNCPSELKYCHQSNEFLFDKFYPIGWSEDGKFAFFYEAADEASGLYHFEFVIQSMVSDKILYKWKLEDEIDLDKGSVKQMFKDNQMLFCAKLDEYGIIQEKKISLLESQFDSNGKKYKVTIENEMELNQDFGFEVVKSTEIFIKCPDLGTKKIYSYTENDYSMVLGASIAGVIKSPYEERVVVLVRSERWGYEGPPDVISCFVVGSNLTETFKK